MWDREAAAKPVGRLIWRWGWCSDGIKVEADRLRRVHGVDDSHVVYVVLVVLDYGSVGR